YAIARVLATGRRSVHVRVYSNRYGDRPATIERSQLFLAPPLDLSRAALNATHPEQRSDPGAFAIGHLPLRRDSFAAWRPRLIRPAGTPRPRVRRAGPRGPPLCPPGPRGTGGGLGRSCRRARSSGGRSDPPVALPLRSPRRSRWAAAARERETPLPRGADRR